MALTHIKSEFYFSDYNNSYKVIIGGVHGDLRVDLYVNGTHRLCYYMAHGHANKTMAAQAINKYLKQNQSSNT